MSAHLIDAYGLRDPAEAGAFDERGRLRVLPAAFWHAYTPTEIAVFCNHHGLYCIPTVELVDWLRGHIGGRRAIEIGAGNGVLADALGIPATDNRMQEWPEIVHTYRTWGQPTVRYGNNVEALDALAAIKRHKPAVTIAAWVTHKWNPREDWREGNMFGVDERKIVRHSEYVLIGHEYTHRHKPILDLAHRMCYPDWLVSRAISPGRNFIGIWEHN